MIENFTPQPWPLLMSDEPHGDFRLLVIGWRRRGWGDGRVLCPVAVSTSTGPGAFGTSGDPIEYEPNNLPEIRYQLPR